MTAYTGVDFNICFQGTVLSCMIKKFNNFKYEPKANCKKDSKQLPKFLVCVLPINNYIPLCLYADDHPADCILAI